MVLSLAAKWAPAQSLLLLFITSFHMAVCIAIKYHATQYIMNEKWGVDGKRSVSLFGRVAQPGAHISDFGGLWTPLQGRDGSPALCLLLW